MAQLLSFENTHVPQYLQTDTLNDFIVDLGDTKANVVGFIPEENIIHSAEPLEFGDNVLSLDYFTSTVEPQNFQYVPSNIPPKVEYADQDTLSLSVEHQVEERPRQIQCHLCPKTVNGITYLKQHQKVHHSGDRPFKCIKCGKLFPTEGELNEHIQKHFGKKPHPCEYCSRGFVHKSDLNRHNMVHTNEYRHYCRYCNKGFTRKDQMLKHEATHK